jgi:mRNA interferase RelE/StbE
MPSYRLDLKSKAAKELAKLPQKEYFRISDKIKALSENPRPHGVKKLKSDEEKYRIRVGDYRVIYAIYDKDKIVEIYGVGDRKDVYR